MFKFLRSISAVIDFIMMMVSESKRKKAQAQRQDEHDEIENDVAGALRDRGWLQSIHRPDGAPVDFDVSGPSGTLDNPSPKGVDDRDA